MVYLPDGSAWRAGTRRPSHIDTDSRAIPEWAEGKAQALRASLASATSLLALLLLEGREAVANPIVTVRASIPFAYVLGSTWEAGTDAANPGTATDTYTFTPLATGSASSTAGYSSAPYFVVGQTALAKLATTSTRGSNAANLNRTGSSVGPISDGNSVFVGTSGRLSLLDAPAILPSAASASFGYTFSRSSKAPAIAKGPAAGVAADEGVPPVDGIDPAGGAAPAEGDGQANTDGSVAVPGTGGMPAVPNSTARSERDTNTISVKPTAGAPAGYTYNPVGRGTPAPAVATGSGTGVSGDANALRPVAGTAKSTEAGRVFAGSVQGASVFTTRSLGGDGTAAPELAKTPSGVIRGDAMKAFYSILQRAASEPNHGNDSLANLTADGYTGDWADASSFSISSMGDGSTLTQDAIVPVPMLVVGNGGGELASSLMIFTTEATTNEDTGDSFTFFLNRSIVQ
jgi:hypothetical protein